MRDVSDICVLASNLDITEANLLRLSASEVAVHCCCSSTFSAVEGHYIEEREIVILQNFLWTPEEAFLNSKKLHAER